MFPLYVELRPLTLICRAALHELPILEPQHGNTKDPPANTCYAASRWDIHLAAHHV